MTLTENDAVEALAAIEAAETKARQLARYRAASPFLLLWGTIWLIGFGGTDFYPKLSHPLWNALSLLGFGITVWLVWRLRCRPRAASSSPAWAWRTIAMMVLGFGFAFGTFLLLRPRSAEASLAYSGLLAGTIYTGLGIFLGMRWLVTGLSLIGLTFAGYFLLPAHFSLWMAVAGGGALILAGLWLRRV
jgi:hypothetical protein